MSLLSHSLFYIFKRLLHTFLSSKLLEQTYLFYTEWNINFSIGPHLPSRPTIINEGFSGIYIFCILLSFHFWRILLHHQEVFHLHSFSPRKRRKEIKREEKREREKREKRVWHAILQKHISQTYINGQLYSPPTMSIIQSISVLHYKNHKKYK